jgi:hypothetical protein
MRIFKTDGAGVFRDKEMPGKYVAYGIRWISSASDAQQQNGSAERMQRTIDETACALMAHAGDVPAYLWAECNNCVGFVHNHSNTIKHKGKVTSRWNVLEGHNKPFDHTKFRPWGCLVYAYIVKKNRGGKGDQARLRARKGVFMGYQWNQKAYRVLFLDTREVRAVAMQYCITNEAFFPYRDLKVWNQDERLMPPSYVIPQVPANVFGQKWDYEDETELYKPQDDADYGNYDLDMSPENQDWRRGNSRHSIDGSDDDAPVGERVHHSSRNREPSTTAVKNTVADIDRDIRQHGGLYTRRTDVKKFRALFSALFKGGKIDVFDGNSKSQPFDVKVAQISQNLVPDTPGTLSERLNC